MIEQLAVGQMGDRVRYPQPEPRYRPLIGLAVAAHVRPHEVQHRILGVPGRTGRRRPVWLRRITLHNGCRGPAGCETPATEGGGPHQITLLGPALTPRGQLHGIELKDLHRENSAEVVTPEVRCPRNINSNSKWNGPQYPW